jgi:hypothetical protein
VAGAVSSLAYPPATLGRRFARRARLLLMGPRFCAEQAAWWDGRVAHWRQSEEWALARYEETGSRDRQYRKMIEDARLAQRKCREVAATYRPLLPQDEPPKEKS